MQLLCRFARSNSVLARLEPKDESSLVPDGELFFADGTVLVDLSGDHSLAPSHLRSSPAPGQAMKRRAAAKHDKYDSHASSCNSRFIPLVVDKFGTVQKDFVDLAQAIEDEALHLGLCQASPTRISVESFWESFSSQWQIDNARVVLQWLQMWHRSA